MEGSHPEEVKGGEPQDLTAAMIMYAMDGRGIVSIKALLKNGEERVMDKQSGDNMPEYTGIGDMQCHHFALCVPYNAKDIKLTVDSDSDCDLILRLCKDSYAFPHNADYYTAEPGPHQELSFQHLDKGMWYVSVQCTTVVDEEDTEYGSAYHDSLGVLNGVPYSIKATWSLKD